MVTRPLRPLGSDAWEFVWSQHLNGPGRPLLRVKLDTWVLGYFSTEDALGLAFTPTRMWASELESRFRKFGQDDKWNFCLKAAMIAANRRDHE
jgi:hypothetical protein